MSHKIKGKKFYTALAIALLATLSIASFGALATSSSAYASGNSIPSFTHVFYIMMENTGTAQLVGNTADAPFVNQMISSYGYDNNYFGVTHTSLPNYVAAISGNNWNSYTDDPTQTFSHTNLVDQLVASHISWKGYMEDLPYAGYSGAYWNPAYGAATTSSQALYVLKHDPFMLFTDFASNAQLAQNVVPLTQLTTDLNSNHVPQFVWISPNVCNDMHGGAPDCPYSNPNAIIQDGDNFLNQTVTAILSSKAWTGNSVIFVTWDETGYGNTLATFTAPGPDAPVAPASAFTYAGFPAPVSGSGVYGGGNVPLIVITTQMTGHGHGSSTGPITIGTYADHYSILRTIEQSWILGYLGRASDSAQVQSLSGFWIHGNSHNLYQTVLQEVESAIQRIERV